MNSLTIEQIEDARGKVLTNAKHLIDEAEILFAAGRYARAYALAHFSCEEIAKLMMLARIGVDLLTGRPVDWKKFFRRFRSHEEKLHNMAIFDYMFLTELDLLHDTDVAKYHEDAKRIPKINATKNRSLYVDIEALHASLPSAAVGRADAEAMIALAHERFTFCERIERSSQGKLAEMVKSPSFGAISKALDAVSNVKPA